MRRLLLLAVLASACSNQPTEPGPTDPPGTPSLTRWSDPASWPGGVVPAPGAEVTIPADKRILLDQGALSVRSLTIEGTLQIDETKDVSLTAGWIAIHGALRVGSASKPYRKRLLITIDGPASDDVMGMGARFLGAMGGTLELFGEPRMTWTRLDATATAGATQFTLVDAPDWRVGDRIVVASSDLDPMQAELLTISAISGRTVTFAPALRFQHYGQVQTFAGKTVDERAEVGLLTHNITVQGDSAGSATGMGGHIIIMQGGQARLSGVELYHMGQKKVLARYPIHWHLSGPSDGQYFKQSTVWKSFNRCVTVHGTDLVHVEQNVCYDDIGHGYFLEDGAETGNTFAGNLGLVTRVPASGEALIPSDQTPATFWITNPDNTYVGNVAAGSRGFGFWFALPEQPTGPSAGRLLYPRRTPLREFRDNVAHSNRNDALHVDNGPKADLTTETVYYQPRQNPAAESDPVIAVFQGFRAYKHANRGAWFRGANLRLTDAVLADNAIGATFAANQTFVENSLFVGQTAIGGSAMPNGFPVRGYEFYDGLVGNRGNTFVNYVASGGREMSAIGFNRANAFALDTQNRAENATFINANRVYIENPVSDKDGDRAAVFLDADGTVSGTAGHYVVVNNPLLVTAACSLRAEWNAYDCNQRYVRIGVRGIDGEVIGPADVTRDDGAAATYVGSGNDPENIFMSLPVGQHFVVRSRAMTATKPQVFANGLAAGDWVRITLPYAGATVKVVRDYDSNNPLPAAASLADLESSSGDRYYRDAAAGLIHLKIMPRNGRDWAALFIVP